MQAEYIREINKSYMKIKSTGNENKFRMNMITGNSVENLLETSRKSINGSIVYMYDITSMTDLRTAYEDKDMENCDLQLLIDSLKSVVTAMKEYFLAPDDLILEPDKIFINQAKKIIKFTYYSHTDCKFENAIKELFEYIIRHINHKDSEAVTLSYGIYKRICDRNYNFEELFEYEKVTEDTYEINEKICPVETVIPEEAHQEKEVPDKKKIAVMCLGVIIIAVGFIVFLMAALIPAIKIGQLGRGGCLFVCAVLGGIAYGAYRFFNNKNINIVKIISETQILSYEKKKVNIMVPKEDIYDEELTVVLNPDENNRQFYLRWDERGNVRSYPLVKDVCIIGSNTEKADCVINETGVSRAHARISKEGGRLYIKDLNSTNGTTVNGRELACFEMCEIKPEDKIIIGKTVCICLTC